ncbi:hypothetical protein G8C92_24200 [Paenibacillus donghaensis]|uniref:hypothetical protein n=1 Tax=Paenibacillus donghaensis TaxID=414771 RepID=UPI001883B556|nr:hypothetical protein [Paenibacillus donghaensis]MBE9917126.1 hypothetical protein [Paenibacillus donghaensis]
MGNAFKKRSHFIAFSTAFLLFTSVTMNVKASPIVTNSESDLTQVNSVQQEEIGNNSVENSEGSSEQNEIPTKNSDVVNPLSENKTTTEKSIFKIKSIDQKLLDLENELLELRKKAVEEPNNLSIEIALKYLELNNENLLLHDFKEKYIKGEESKYEEQMNSYYKSKEQQFSNLMQKYQEAIVKYSKALNVPVDKKSRASLYQSVVSPKTEDIKISRSVLTDKQDISVKVTVYHVQDDQQKNKSETDEVNNDQPKGIDDQQNNKNETEEVKNDQAESANDQQNNKSETEEVNNDQPESVNNKQNNKSETEEVNNDQSEGANNQQNNKNETEEVNNDQPKSANNQKNNESETNEVNNDQLPLMKTIISQEEYKNIHSGENLDISVKRDPSITEGYYLVELKYSDSQIPTEYLKYAAATEALTSSNATINANQFFDVNLGPGISQVYEFTATKTKAHRLFTGPYGSVGGSNDTVLEIYSDAALTKLISSNDDYNGTSFSSITFLPNAGQKYYIKLRTYSSTASLNCRITMQMMEPIVFSETSAQYAYNANGSLWYISYGSGKLLAYVYDNNGNVIRKVLMG